MSAQAPVAHEEPAPRRRTYTYVAVIVVEVLVVAALWLLGKVFTS